MEDLCFNKTYKLLYRINWWQNQGNLIDHNKCDKNSNILKHSCEEDHSHVLDKDFKVFRNNYFSTLKQKIDEVIFIKQLKPSHNVKSKSS